MRQGRIWNVLGRDSECSYVYFLPVNMGQGHNAMSCVQSLLHFQRFTLLAAMVSLPVIVPSKSSVAFQIQSEKSNLLPPESEHLMHIQRQHYTFPQISLMVSTEKTCFLVL